MPIRLHELSLRQGAVLDRIRRLHEARNQSESIEERAALLSDLLAANQERIELESELRSLRRKLHLS